MKNTCLVFIIILIFVLSTQSQTSDSAYQKRVLSKTEIELFFSNYNQDGNHSAVTGGNGTEVLHVYAPGFNLTHSSGFNVYSIEGGADVISSASTDMIDANISSASKVDIRSYANVAYSRQLKQSAIIFGIGTGFSMESDYLSFPVRFSIDYSEPSNMRQYHLIFQAFFDDLRWGRLNPEYRRPVTLVYPKELRYKEWYDVHNRYSYNLKFGFKQVVNQRMVVGFYPELTYQKGLLATPFHRVYFTNDSVRVENFPKERWRFPLNLRVNYFAGSITILKVMAGFYRDNFGITSGTFDLEAAIKIQPQFTLSPFIRIYSQTASQYFRPFRLHDPEENYYTSDYDLSKFQSFKTGIAFRYVPVKYLWKRNIFQEISMRYTFFQRSDGLVSHIVTMAFGFSRQNSK
jgi:hypothetical protein